MSPGGADYKKNYSSSNIFSFAQSFGGFSCEVKAGTANAKKAVIGGDKKKAMAMAALKSHSDAERRRRERINSHLATLRCLLPFTQKMDKASLLAEVIRQVKELKEKAMEASKGLVIPTTECDEVKVEGCKVVDNVSSFKATICCGFQPHLLSQVRQSLDQLRWVKLAKVEMCTVGGRLKTELLFTINNNAAAAAAADNQRIVDTVQRAITCVLELEEKDNITHYLPPPPNKRRRLSCSSSSSL